VTEVTPSGTRQDAAAPEYGQTTFAVPSVTTGGLHAWLTQASLSATADAPDGASATPIPAAANTAAVPLTRRHKLNTAISSPSFLSPKETIGYAGRDRLG
jgi:hypothetical protein